MSYCNTIINGAPLTDSTGGAFEELVALALGAGGVAQYALVLKEEPSGLTRRRSSALSGSRIEEHQKRDGELHCNREDSHR